MATAHLRGEPGDYAPVVLMPGDPLRAKFIAENYLDDVTQNNDIRNMLGFTGTYNGTRVSVQGSGMGIPSFQIYAYELVNHFGVEQIVRIGSCGALQDELNLGDVIIATGAGTDSNVNRARLQGRDLPAVASWRLLKAAADAAAAHEIDVHMGTLFTSDFFYDPNDPPFELLARYGFLGVEMEAAALYGLAAEFGIEALAICTVSDHIMRSEAMSPEDRQTSFDAMMKLTLEAVTA